MHRRDCKFDLTGLLWQSYNEALQALPNDLYSRLCIATTQSGGYHIIYRCEVIQGNHHLAERPSTPDEIAAKNKETADWNAANPDKKPKVFITKSIKALIETRGEGGYFLVYPSDGYKFIQRNPTTIETITPEEREMLFACARVHTETDGADSPTITQKSTFNASNQANNQNNNTNTASQESVRPGDDFNSQHSALDVLGCAYERGNAKDHQGRAGVRICNSPNGEPNGFYYPSPINKVFVFSPNYGIPIEKALTPFEIYTHCNHHGDFSAAATELAAKGYGSKGKPQPQQQAKPKTMPMPTHNDNVATAKTDGGGLENNPYFRILGFDKTESGVQAFFFYRKGSNTLLRLTASAMSKNNLMTLAPLQWWEQMFERSKGGVDVDCATNWLIQVSQNKGHFRTKYVRGRGAWIDGGAVVIHTGDKLIVDGREKTFEAHTSKFVYESGEELGIGTSNPLSKSEAAKFLDICGTPSWVRGVNSTLLAGWCVIAPVCGALPWRPHLWIVGESGTGKSTVFRGIVKRMLGQAAIGVQGNTSESGLRQTLQFDAIPVVFDEAEAEDKASQDRMAAVLALMRASSSEDGGRIIKGGQDGQAKAYDIRSCFAYASIVFQATQQSDMRRITVLETKKINDKVRASALVKKLNTDFAILTDEYVSRFQARTVKLLPTILENAKVFGRAVVEVIGQQWAGDQIGILLAGAWSLHQDCAVTYEEALAFVQQQDWSEEKGLEQQTDQMRLVAKIAEQPIRISVGQDRTVGELILHAANVVNYNYDAYITPDDSNAALKRLGISVTEREGVTMVLISNTADWVKKTLSGTPWHTNHSKLLMRIEGAIDINSYRFAAIKSRAVGLPLDIFKD